jgi:LysR family hydrogen peroxide-inducible transcriptional activator
MVGAGLGVTLIPEMAVAVETRSAHVSLARFDHPKPSRTIGMIWRKTSPLAKQLGEISDVVRHAAELMRQERLTREEENLVPASRQAAPSSRSPRAERRRAPRSQTDGASAPKRLS